ncbi:amidase [Tamilnaduibacter salinus]|uniref:Amidase n=1 Tax=Tamilnaduibacter salinus TaxID=1484056 RepID=A0A2A2I562_9GAMM|nr:amidase [Tamilnaduibacter salinus]PAV26722.1 amidase [Tamilnaduibacter salinus]PVY79115.1 amidase [Tamilnaduibacter salinus]
MSDTIHAFTDDALGNDDATAMAERLRRGDVTARELTDAAIERAEKMDPILHGIEYRDYDRARQDANRAVNGFFAGVPTWIKDNADLAGAPTGHGSRAVRRVPAERHGVFVRQLLSTGLIGLGKSTLPEFGLNASTEFPEQPPTSNPWNPRYSCGASSGGSAAMVAAGVVPIAHANDGGGSIRIPAACCGLVGLKPTRSRLVDSEASRALPVNIVCDGVVTRSMRDTANFMAAAEQYRKARRMPAIGRVEGPGQRRLRIGLITDSITGHPTDADTRETVEQAGRILHSLGHHIEPMKAPVPPMFINMFAHYWRFLAFSMKKGGRFMTGPGFDPSQVDGLTEGLYRRYLTSFYHTPWVLPGLQMTRRAYARTLNRLGLDAVLSPTLAHKTPELGYLSPNVPFDELFERLIRYVSFTPLANASGAPALSLPMGLTDDNLPVGVHLSGHHGDERTLLELGFALEQAHGWPQIQEAAGASASAAAQTA